MDLASITLFVMHVAYIMATGICYKLGKSFCTSNFVKPYIYNIYFAIFFLCRHMALSLILRSMRSFISYLYSVFSWKILHELDSFIRLGIYSVLMMGLEWWACEASLLFAGTFHIR